ncbi:MAG TPA: hypothetical protein VEF76_12000, partial [Patescibacteria group bacterium]|nr:hypothetical protein [Patescibacteria group bacterium]
MKLFGKKSGNAGAPESDAIDDLGDIEGFDEADAVAPAASLKAPSRLSSAKVGGSRRTTVLILVLAGVLLAGGGYLWLMNEPEDIAIHVTATETATPPQPAAVASADTPPADAALPAPSAPPTEAAAAPAASTDPLAPATPVPVMPAS